MLLLGVLLLLVACARGQVDLEAADLQDEFDALSAEVVAAASDPFAAFPDPAPLVVPRNKVNRVERAIVTSPLPAWAIAVLGASAVVAAIAIITLIFALVSGQGVTKGTKTMSVVLAIVLLAAAAAGIAASLVLGMRQATPTGLQRGATIPLDRAIVRAVSVGNATGTSGMVWFIAAIDAKGAEKQVYDIEDAGLAMTTDTSGDHNSLPRPNAPIKCTLYVVSSGKVTLTQWTVLPSEASRAASIGNKRLAVYRIKFASNDCGGGVTCSEPCSEDALRKMLLTGPMSMASFYKQASLGRFVIDSVDVYDVTIPEDTPTWSSLTAINTALGGQKTADFHVMFFPPNTRRDQFAGNAAGYGGVGGTSSWMKMCVFSVVAHEAAHNFGLHHSGALNPSNQFVEYADYSTVMGSGYISPTDFSVPGPGWVGLSAPQLFAMGWLPNDAFFTIEGNGFFIIKSSLSSNRGMRAALVKASQGEFWIEWREAVNQDVDLPHAQRFFDNSVIKPKGKLIKSLLVKTRSSDAKTQLEAIINSGTSATVNGIRIQHSTSVGQFFIGGFSETASNTAASVSGTTTSTRPTAFTVGTDATVRPTVTTPTTAPQFKSCRSSAGRAGLCRPVATCRGTTVSNLCPGQPANVKCCFV